MAKMMGPRFKLSRRLGVNVCGHPKAMDRAKPGTCRGDKKLSNYGIQLLEKQKLRAYYGVLEKQMKRYMNEAKKNDGITGEVLVQSLETRLDNIVFRIGLASSIRQARQMVNHGHILVNGRKVDIPSYRVKIEDTVSLREKSRNTQLFVDNFTGNFGLGLDYLERDIESFSGKLSRIPARIEIPIEIDEHLVVEYYS